MTGWERPRRPFRSHGAFRSLLALLVVLAALLPGRLASQQLSPAQVEALKAQVRAVGGRVIVQVRPNQGARLRADGRSNMSDQAVAGIQANLERRGLRNPSRVQIVPLVFGEAGDAELDALLADPNVLTIEADIPVAHAEWRENASPRPALGTAESTPWGVERVTAPAAWALTSPALTGIGIKVAFLDSGGDINHPDLAWAGGYNAITGSTVPSAWHDDLSVCAGHGTHVAGTIGARQNTQGVVGVAPGVSLYAIKVFENISGSCRSYVSKQVAGLNWAVQQGVRVVSISIGGTTFVSSYDQAITAAIAAGTHVVAAAGNNGSTAITYPANYANALAIGALTASNTKSSYSNYGPKLFLAAPGDGIQSTVPGGGYGTKSGTSMATPHVAGVIALLLADDPTATRSEILSRLQVGALDLGVTGRDDATGWGLARAYESITSGGAPPPVPLVLAVNPASRTASTVAGSTAAKVDSGAVSLSGTNAGATSWSATKRKPWTTLTTAGGTGSGTVRWSRNPTGLAAGTWVDTITVTAGGAGGSPDWIIDTLVVTAASSPLTLAVSPSVRRASAVAGSTTMLAAEGVVTLTGTNSGSTAWTASKRRSWTTLTLAAGTGSGEVRWSRNPTGLAAGVYVDTITVTAAGAVGSPDWIIDSLTITAGSAPLALAVNPASGLAAAVVGSTTIMADSGTVALSGTNAGATSWTAAKRKGWTTLTTAGGTGSGTVRWSRNPAGLAAGTWVDTISVTAAGAGGSPDWIIDTLVITAAPAPLVLAVNPGSRSAAALAGSSAIIADSGSVTLSGSNAAGTAWTATKRKTWTTLTTASGTGSGTVRWSRNPSGLGAGTWVDTITVTASGASGSPTSIIDSLVITAAPVPLGLAVSPPSRLDSIVEGRTTPVLEDAAVSLTGSGSGTATWSATRRQPWTTLSTASGIGSGIVSWSRNPTGLLPGTYVDTITVTASGATGSPARVIDSLVVTAEKHKGWRNKPAEGAFTVMSPATAQAAAMALDSVLLDPDGVETGAISWTATSDASWLRLTRLAGDGRSPVAWRREAGALPVGLHVGRITILVAAGNEQFELVFADTVMAGVEDPTVDLAGLELFEPNRLTAHQRTLLDQLGNRNGGYDAGDFLAWVDRVGTAPSSAVMRRVLALPQVPPGTRPKGN